MGVPGLANEAGEGILPVLLFSFAVALSRRSAIHKAAHYLIKTARYILSVCSSDFLFSHFCVVLVTL